MLLQLIHFSFPPYSRALGGLAEQDSMASVHVDTVCQTSQTLIPNKHSCAETMLLLEHSLQGSAVGFDPEIVDYRSISDFRKKKHLLTVV